MAYYYPEGYFGPICDDRSPDTVVVEPQEGDDDGDYVVTEPDPYPDDWEPPIDDVPWERETRCKQRLLPDGTTEFYDCITDWDFEPPSWDEWKRCIAPNTACYNFDDEKEIGLDIDDVFPELEITPETCSPHDPDINIRDSLFFDANGILTRKKRRQKSTPPTYPVSSNLETLISESQLDAVFTEDVNWDVQDPAIAPVADTGTYFRDWGSGSGELGGFAYINGSGPKYLSFSSPGTDPFPTLQMQREARYTLDMTGFNRLYVQAIIGNDRNGGERVNDAGEGLRVIWPNNTETVILPSRRDYLDANPGFSASAYDDEYQQFKNQYIDIPSQYQTSGVTIRFRQDLADDALGEYKGGGTVRTNNPNGYDSIGITKIGLRGVALQVTGTGSGTLALDFQWDDNPNTYGTALGTIDILSHTFTQTSGVEEGNQSHGQTVTPGVYPITIANNSGGYSVKDSGKRICFFDTDNDDCNAELIIGGITNTVAISNTSYWSDLGNETAVWVNPEVCTLPLLPQFVTYTVPIEATDNYTFEVGADDQMQLFIDDEEQPIFDIVGGIFRGGEYATPYTYSRVLNGGTILKMTVRAQNSAAGFLDGESQPYGLAYSWARNPGGWFIRICRGGACASGGRGIYPLTYVGLNSANSSINVTGSGKEIRLLDGGGDDTNASFKIMSTSSGIDASFSSDGQQMNVTGSGDGTVSLRLEWDDDPSNNGVAVQTIEVNGQTWTQSGTSGQQDFTIDVIASVGWVPSGPWDTWSDLMNTYAVWTSKTDADPGVTKYAYWSVTVPYAGNYILKTAADNTADFSVDNVPLLTQTGFTTSDTTTTTLNLTSGPHVISAAVVNTPNTSYAADPIWANNPAGVAWTLESDALGNVGLKFANSGQLVATGQGFATVQLNFEWDDNPNTYSTALGTVKWQDLERVSGSSQFTQTPGVEDGNDSAVFRVEGGRTYNIEVMNNTGGYTIENNGQRICFKDYDGDDCNARVDIGTITQLSGGLIGSSLDLSGGSDGNIIWTTRDATGYEYYED